MWNKSFSNLIVLFSTVLVLSSCTPHSHVGFMKGNVNDDTTAGNKRASLSLSLEGSLSSLVFQRNYGFKNTAENLDEGEWGLHTATLLPDGKILIAGGLDKSWQEHNLAELYDPETQTFSVTGSLHVARFGHTATLLPNGNVLIVGGQNNKLGDVLDSAELYDPETSTFSIVGSLNATRIYHTATLLADGRVLIIGGCCNGNDMSLNSAELYDPDNNSFSFTRGKLNVGRNHHTSTLLANGTVLIVGGTGKSGTLNSVELYDPDTQTFNAIGNCSIERQEHTATLLQDGKVLIAGGHSNGGIALNSAELYDPDNQLFSTTKGTLTTLRSVHTATLLLDGRVLLVGGYSQGDYLKLAELYDPIKDIFISVESLGSSRLAHTATLLPDGKVLIVGGWNSDGVLNSAELFSYTSEGTYQTQFTANGGTPPYTYSILSGGGIIDKTTGLYSALFALGDMAVIKVVDSKGAFATANIDLNISE